MTSEHREHMHTLQRRVEELRFENAGLRRELARIRKPQSTQPRSRWGWTLLAGAIGAVGIFRWLATSAHESAPETPEEAREETHDDVTAPPTQDPTPARRGRRDPAPQTPALPQSPAPGASEPNHREPITWAFAGTLSKLRGSTFDRAKFSSCEIRLRRVEDANAVAPIDVFEVACWLDEQAISLFSWNNIGSGNREEISKWTWTGGATSEESVDLDIDATFSSFDFDDQAFVPAHLLLDTATGRATVTISHPHESIEIELTNVEPGRDYGRLRLERLAHRRAPPR